MRKLLTGVVAAVTALSLLPSGADNATAYLERYVPAEAGQEKKLTYFFGPYHIPPGQDSNRLTLDVPISTGFITAVAPNLVDAVTNEEPPARDAHIHHAHWFRISNDPGYEYYTDLERSGIRAAGLSWVFGTGEEKTQGSFTDRADVVRDANGRPTGPRYGIFIDGNTPQLFIYMLHNKTARPLNLYVTLEVSFIPGTLEQVNAADPSRPMHPVTGQLWGQTRDATKDYPMLTARYVARADGTAIATAGHLHPGGREVAIANLGPAVYDEKGALVGGRCAGDADGDGFPGVTILHSRKFDRIPSAFPWSEDYQMGASKFGWRAPIHKGDLLQQFAPYDVDGKAAYEAMSYTGIYVDRAQKPAARTDDGVCDVSHYQAYLLGDDAPAVQGGAIGTRYADRFAHGANEGLINHVYHHITPHCGLQAGADGATALDTRPCENRGNWPAGRGDVTSEIHVAGFVYAPGDMALANAAGVPRVRKGTKLTVINEDAALNIRHTLTSCNAPCRGDYTANFPIPNGVFDTDKLGNLDPIDGGFSGDWMPQYTIDTSKLSAGVHAYYCRIHPFMRGAFELVE